MVTTSEAAEEYISALSDLTRNDKTQINLLTILAEDYASFSSEIVKVIEDSLYKFPVQLKIVVLYVVDSIVKNVQVTGGYRDLFARKIVDMIVHVFKESDEKTRASIHRLRLTWTDIFPKARLYMIDTKINAIDKAWPILNPNTRVTPAPSNAKAAQTAAGGHVVHVNPRFLNGKTKTPSSRPEHSPAVTVKKEPEEEVSVSSTTPEPSSSNATSLVVTIQNEKQKSPEKPIKKENSVEEEKLPSKEVAKKDGKKPSKEAKKESKSGGEKEEKASRKKEEKRAEKKTPSAEQPSSKVIKERRKSKDAKDGQQQERVRKRTSEPALKKPKQEPVSSIPGMGRIPKKSTTTQKQQQPKPESLMSLRINPPATFVHQMHPPPQKQQQQAPLPSLNAQAPPMKRPRASHPPPSAPQQQQHGFPSNKHGPPPELKPTAALGAHAFGHNVVAAAANTPPRTEPPSMMMDTSTASSFQSTPGVAMHDQSQPLFSAAPQPSFPAAPQYNIQNVTPRLPGVPENNRIFVEGKAYEVFYLEQVAVIERNGLPHRVSFAGPSRDVIIDGVAHRLAFGEQKQVLIDGGVHVLRFGAPSRELYMGEFPFKGAFGGPPIIATIDGRRHEIRLCGPPPEVRIDPEPSYELMRYMPAARQQMPQQPKVEPKKEPSLDLTTLLKRLRNSGVLSQLSEAERRNRDRQSALIEKGAAIGRSNSPPVPCSHRLDHIERRPTPMAGFDQFSMRSLVIRYDSVIDAIHRQRKSCQHCGISFDELYGESYQRHVDWHLQDTLRMKDPRYKYTRSQPWYMLDDWFNYSETELVNRVQSTEVNKQASGKEESTTGQQMLEGNQDAPSDSIETKECQVCHEQFDEYWDEEEDVWRLRDCIISSNGKAYHTYCREDAVNAAESAQEQAITDEARLLDTTDSDLRVGSSDFAMEVDMGTSSQQQQDGRVDEEEEEQERSQPKDEFHFSVENKGIGDE